MNADIPIVNILALDGEVGLYVGGSGMGTARVFPADVPQNVVLPHIVVDLFDAEAEDTKDGVAYTDNEVIKVFSYAGSVRDSRGLSKKVRNALDGYSRTTIGGEEIKYIRYLRTDSYNISLTNKKVYVREQDFQVRIKN